MGTLDVKRTLQTMDDLSKEPLTINSMSWVFAFLKDRSIFDVDIIEKRLQALIDQAELGKLALKTQPCYYEYQYNDGDCHMERCSSCELCRVRSEMLRGKVINE